MHVTRSCLPIVLAFGLFALCVFVVSTGGVRADPPAPAREPRVGLPITLAPGGASPEYTGCGGGTAPVVNAAYEQQVVELVNQTRAENKLPPLKRVAVLDASARYFSTDMGQDNYFPSDHATYDRNGGTLVKVCDWSARIQSFYTGSLLYLAENIAAGQGTPQDVMSSWMNSPGHRSNILSQSVWEIGVGYYEGSGDYRRYWTQDFGRRSGVYPLVINADGANTDRRDVSLYIYGDWGGGQMRLQNDTGAWTAWQPFQSPISWTLASGVGSHTVSVELKNMTLTAAATSSDSVYLSRDSQPCYDFNRTGQVDAADIDEVVRRWDKAALYDSRYDTNADGRIDLRDVERVAASWGTRCSP